MDLNVAEERQVFIADGDGLPKLDKEYKAIYNASLDKNACIASRQYNVIQHREAALSLKQALMGLNIKHDIVIRQFKHCMYVDVTFPDAPQIKLQQKGEEFAIGLRLINSYDKSTGLVICPRVTRMVCSNGMVLKMLGEGVVMKHTNKSLAEGIAGRIEKTLNDIIQSQPNLQAMVNNCIADSIEWRMVEKIMERLIGRKKHIDMILHRVTVSDGKITRWALYNALTSYATHGEQLTPSVEAWLQTKAQRLLRTPLREFSISE